MPSVPYRPSMTTPAPPPTRAESIFAAPRPTRAERRAKGKAKRRQVPLISLGEVDADAQRKDPLTILHAQDASRDQTLVPVRYERMAANPFAFLRGAAAVMASDLGRLPTSGIGVQLCGDAHVANFGMFGSAERDLVFDVNDFDETLRGPFDWDVRRLAASAVEAALVAGHSDKTARRAAAESARMYRVTMSRLSKLTTLDAWYVKLDVSTLLKRLDESRLKSEIQDVRRQARRRTGDQATDKLTELVDGRRRFRSDPPLLVPLAEADPEGTVRRLAPVYGNYLATLQADRAALLHHYSFVDLALKVVGVGSVGTRAGIILLESGDGDPLLLQVKQALTSVLEPYLGESPFASHGERVVYGQRVMQATGDPFLGFVRMADDGSSDFYLRQFRDMKGSVETEGLDRESIVDYAGLCGGVLARAHARVGDPSMISGYLGSTDEFDVAMADFAVGYSSITKHDYALLTAEQAKA